jgi:hypothetical protein
LTVCLKEHAQSVKVNAIDEFATTHLEPSANLICTDVTGLLWSTSNVGTMFLALAPLAAAAKLLGRLLIAAVVEPWMT